MKKDTKFTFEKANHFVSFPTHPYPAGAPFRAVGLDLQSRPIEYKDLPSATTMCCAKMARVAIKSQPFHHAFGGLVLFVLCRVPVGTLVYHGTARTLSSCTVLCKVASLTGRWLIYSLLTALRGLCLLVPCYARSRPCRDAGLEVV